MPKRLDESQKGLLARPETMRAILHASRVKRSYWEYREAAYDLAVDGAIDAALVFEDRGDDGWFPVCLTYARLRTRGAFAGPRLPMDDDPYAIAEVAEPGDDDARSNLDLDFGSPESGLDFEAMIEPLDDTGRMFLRLVYLLGYNPRAAAARMGLIEGAGYYLLAGFHGVLRRDAARRARFGRGDTQEGAAPWPGSTSRGGPTRASCGTSA